MRHNFKLCLAATCLVALAASAPVHAAPVAPTFDTFGDFPSATFGGSGIPHDPVAVSTISPGDGSIIFGLAASARFSNPVVTHNNLGTFFATPGENDGGSPAHGLGATWNFNFYISVENLGSGSIGEFLDANSVDIQLLYDFDPGAATDETELGKIDLIVLLGNALFNTATIQDSENLDFSFLAALSTGITPPSFSPFDPNAIGEYTFALRLVDANGNVLVLPDQSRAETAINVDVVPEPATLAIIGFGLVGIGIIRRHKRRA